MAAPSAGCTRAPSVTGRRVSPLLDAHCRLGGTHDDDSAAAAAGGGGAVVARLVRQVAGQAPSLGRRVAFDVEHELSWRAVNDARAGVIAVVFGEG